MLCAYDAQRTCKVTATVTQGQSRRNARPKSHREGHGAVELTVGCAENTRRGRGKIWKHSEPCTYDSLSSNEKSGVWGGPTATNIVHTDLLGMHMADQLDGF